METLIFSFPAQISSDKFNGVIPLDKLDITYSGSSGPGGQNVNKVHTKCDVRFKVADVTWIPAATKAKFLAEHQHRLTKEGYYVVKSDLTRFRHMNLADALEKLRNLIRNLEREEKQPDVETVEKHKRRYLLNPSYKYQIILISRTFRMERESARRLMVKRDRSLIKGQRQGL